LKKNEHSHFIFIDYKLFLVFGNILLSILKIKLDVS